VFCACLLLDVIQATAISQLIIGHSKLTRLVDALILTGGSQSSKKDLIDILLNACGASDRTIFESICRASEIVPPVIPGDLSEAIRDSIELLLFADPAFSSILST
jgi:hypothetical protein